MSGLGASSTAASVQTSSSQLLDQFTHAVADDLRLFASLHGRELTPGKIAELAEISFPDSLGLILEGEENHSVLDLIRAEVSGWKEGVGKDIQDELAADYAAIYLNNYCSASPQESYWLDEENLAWQEPMFRVRETYREFGLAVENWRVHADDHLVPQLEFIAFLFSEADTENRLEQAASFMDEHLLLWLEDFSARVAKRCDTKFYATLAVLTNIYCETLRNILAEMLDMPRLDKKEMLAKLERERVQAVPVKFIPGTEASW